MKITDDISALNEMIRGFLNRNKTDKEDPERFMLFICDSESKSLCMLANMSDEDARQLLLECLIHWNKIETEG